MTGQAYSYTGDDPVNGTDPTGAIQAPAPNPTGEQNPYESDPGFDTQEQWNYYDCMGITNLGQNDAGEQPGGSCYYAAMHPSASGSDWVAALAPYTAEVAHVTATGCTFASVFGVWDEVTVPCAVIATGVATIADAGLAADGNGSWSTVGWDALGLTLSSAMWSLDLELADIDSSFSQMLRSGRYAEYKDALEAARNARSSGNILEFLNASRELIDESQAYGGLGTTASQSRFGTACWAT
jgi:hypothetical protein